MDPAQLSDDQLDDLADAIAPRLPTGTHGDRVILSRRQFAAAATGTLGAGALMALGVDPASAQAAGSQGTADEPNDMFAHDLNVANGVTSSLPMNGNDIENAGSVSADETTIMGTGPIKEVGYVDFGTVAAGESELVSTTFANDYSSPPAVSVSLGTTSDSFSSGDLPQINASAYNITTSDFGALIRNDSATDYQLDSCVYVVLDS